MLKKFKAMVKLATGTSSESTNMQWVYEDAKNAFEARLAIEAKYGTRVIQGPIEITESGGAGSFFEKWRNA